MSGMGVDLVITPSKGRARSMLLADMDSHVSKNASTNWARAVWRPRKEITTRAMNGELDFEEARANASAAKGAR